jgi:hypothetical protein
MGSADLTKSRAPSVVVSPREQAPPGSARRHSINPPVGALVADSPTARSEAVAPSPVYPREEALSWRGLDDESQMWWNRLHRTGPIRSRAIAELHERLRREAEFYVRHHARRLSDFP